MNGSISRRSRTGLRRCTLTPSPAARPNQDQNRKNLIVRQPILLVVAAKVSTFLRAVSSLMYTPKQVPLEYQHIIGACQRGDLAAIKAHWKPEFRDHFLQIGPDDTWHPLLHAAHHLNVDVVQFLCEQGLNPHQKGTVHPYTGDGLIVAELQGVSPVEVVDRMLFIHTRRSKRKVKLLQVKEVLMKAAHYVSSLVMTMLL